MRRHLSKFIHTDRVFPDASHRRALAFTLAATACAGDPATRDAGGGVRDTLPDGTPVVRYASLPTLAEATLLAPNLRIGSLESDGPDVFGDVRGVEARLFDVFSTLGEYRGSLRLGADAAAYLPPRVRHGHLYTLVLDDLDVPHLIRARLPEWAAAGR